MRTLSGRNRPARAAEAVRPAAAAPRRAPAAKNIVTVSAKARAMYSLTAYLSRYPQRGNRAGGRGCARHCWRDAGRDHDARGHRTSSEFGVGSERRRSADASAGLACAVPAGPRRGWVLQYVVRQASRQTAIGLPWAGSRRPSLAAPPRVPGRRPLDRTARKRFPVAGLVRAPRWRGGSDESARHALAVAAMAAAGLAPVAARSADKQPRDHVRYEKKYRDPVVKSMEHEADSLKAVNDSVSAAIQKEYRDRDKKKSDEKPLIRFDWSRIVKPASPEAFKPPFHFPPHRQYRTGTCWSFSTTSLLRDGGATPHRPGDQALRDAHRLLGVRREGARLRAKRGGQPFARAPSRTR